MDSEGEVNTAYGIVQLLDDLQSVGFSDLVGAAVAAMKSEESPTQMNLEDIMDSGVVEKAEQASLLSYDREPGPVAQQITNMDIAGETAGAGRKRTNNSVNNRRTKKQKLCFNFLFE
jgi:hypothetical protein